MHRETTISREIKLLKNKFELLEKNRQFRSILQKSNNSNLIASTSDNNDPDLICAGLEANESQRTRSEATSEAGSLQQEGGGGSGQAQSGRRASKSVRIKLSKFRSLSGLLAPLFGKKYRKRGRRKNNRVSSIGHVVPVETRGNGTSNGQIADGVDGSGGLLLEAKGGPDAATAAAAASALTASSAAITAATLEVKLKKEATPKGGGGRLSLIKRANVGGASVFGRLFSGRKR